MKEIVNSRRAGSFLGLLFLILMLPSVSIAQKQFSDQYMRQHPIWISMMNDSSCNFFQAERAFELYFSEHAIPKEEDEIIGSEDSNDRTLPRRIFRLFPQKRNEYEAEMAFNVKKYRHWHLLTLPWVREDGSVIGPVERKLILDGIGR